jgi:deoxyribodipyrimidine photo-lyase
LKETGSALKKRGIQMVVRRGEPVRTVLDFSKEASFVVCDRGYLRRQRNWRKEVAEHADCPVFMVESDVVVAPESVSWKAEYAARTLRPKLEKRLTEIKEQLGCPKGQVRVSSLNLSFQGILIDDVESALRGMKIDREIGPVTDFFRGGTAEAKRRFDRFLKYGLNDYPENHKKPHENQLSHMSPYLHFGQISPVYLFKKTLESTTALPEGRQAFLEQLIVRRELSINFVLFEKNYDSFESLPDWSKKTLEKHKNDTRNPVYDAQTLENAETADMCWNAAMKEMKITGYMQNYMRMYWGKKILEWSEKPEIAYDTILYLNNRYFLDGRDPNSYAGAGWVFGLHDRPFKERDIFGTVRYMSEKGLKQKTDMKRYIKESENRFQIYITGSFNRMKS